MKDLYTNSYSLLEEPESDIIKKAQKNPRDFEPLYNAYYKRIFLFVLHKVNDKAQTADITSQVFLKALLNINDFVYKGLPFSSWLFRVAVNEVNAFFRKNTKYKHVILDQEIIELLQSQIEIIESEASSLKEKLPKVIQNLKKEEIQLIDLRFYESFSFKEIGDILDITENNAKVKLYRLLDKLRKNLTKK